MSNIMLIQVRDRLRSYAKDADLYASKTGKSLELTTADELADAVDAHIAGMGEPVDVGLVERLRKRAAEERQIAENNARVAELLSPELALLKAGDGYNIYAARMAIDHRDSAKKDAAFARDLDAAADKLEAAINGGA